MKIVEFRRSLRKRLKNIKIKVPKPFRQMNDYNTKKASGLTVNL